MSGVFQVPVAGGGHEVMEIPIAELPTTAHELGDLIEVLVNEECLSRQWTTLAREYLKSGHEDLAREVLERSLQASAIIAEEKEILPCMAMLASVTLAQAGQLLTRNLGKEAQEDALPAGKSTRDALYRKVSDLLNRCDRIDQKFTPVWLCKGQLHQARGDFDNASACFNNALKLEPTNLLALVGLAKIQMHRQNWVKAADLFKSVIKYRPNFKPDVRVGLGLCLWHMGNKKTARMAWQRSHSLDPENPAALTLLGLDALAISKAALTAEAERPIQFKKAIECLQKAFKLQPFHASSAALALSNYFLAAGVPKRAIKLAERAVQTADHRSNLIESYLALAQSFHRQGDLDRAFRYYKLVQENAADHVLATIGSAQIFILKYDLPAATHVLESLLSRKPKCVEAMIILGSIHSGKFPGSTVAEAANRKTMAREIFDRALRYAAQERATSSTSGDQNPVELTEDEAMFTTIARLWQDDHLDKALRSYQNAARVKKEMGETASPLLLNNIAALEQMKGRFEQAEKTYQQALFDLDRQDLDRRVGDAHRTTIQYNLARVYEQRGETALAQDQYSLILLQHPEYTDAKVRMASILRSKGEKDAAHELLKQCLLGNPKDLNLRSAYIHFLTSVGTLRPAKELAFQTLKDYNTRHVYTLVVAGWIHYVQAREARIPPPGGSSSDTKAIASAEKDRETKFYRSVEFYNKALQIDPSCVYAAQGLAIALAENNLGSLPPPAGTGKKQPDDEASRLKNLKDAIMILSKVRDSIDDASVQINLGHAYFGTEEWLRSIECYETANRRFLKDSDPNLLMCCARAWHARASAESNYQIMNRALHYAQLTVKSNPDDLIIKYNVAFIQQKSLELILATAPFKRNIEDLEKCAKQGREAKETFEFLAKVQEPKTAGSILPYSVEMAHQRARYGDSLLKSVPEALENQQAYNDQVNQKLNDARRVRQEAKERDAEAERMRMEAIAKEAQELAEKRRAMKDEANQWAAASEISAEYIAKDEERRSRRSAAAASGGGGRGRKKKGAKEEGDGLIDDSELGQQGLFGSDDDSHNDAEKDDAGVGAEMSDDDDTDDDGRDAAVDQSMSDAERTMNEQNGHEATPASQDDSARRRRKELKKLAKTRAKGEQKANKKRRMKELTGDSGQPTPSNTDGDGEVAKKKKRILSAAVIESDDDEDM